MSTLLPAASHFLHAPPLALRFLPVFWQVSLLYAFGVPQSYGPDFSLTMSFEPTRAFLSHCFKRRARLDRKNFPPGAVCLRQVLAGRDVRVSAFRTIGAPLFLPDRCGSLRVRSYALYGQSFASHPNISFCPKAFFSFRARPRPPRADHPRPPPSCYGNLSFFLLRRTALLDAAVFLHSIKLPRLFRRICTFFFFP